MLRKIVRYVETTAVPSRQDCINSKSVYGVEHNQMKPFTFSARYENGATPSPVSLTHTVNGITNCELKHSSVESERCRSEEYFWKNNKILCESTDIIAEQ